LRWISPEWAWLLLPALIALVWYHARSLSDFALKQRRFSLLVRVVVVCLLIAALCQPVFLRETTQQMLVFLIDQSESIDEAARTETDKFLKAALGHAQAENADVRFLPFSRSPGAIQPEWKFATPADNPTNETDKNSSQLNLTLASQSVNTASAADSETEAVEEANNEQTSSDTEKVTGDDAPLGTDLTAGIQAALAAIPPSRVARIVLLSDGNANHGSDPIATAGNSPVPISTVPLQTRSDPDVQLTRIEAPTQVRQGEPFYVEVVVSSNHDTEGHVDLYRGDIQIGEPNPQPVQVKKGENRFRFRQTILGKRQESFAARLRGFNDTLLDNNEAATVVYAEGKPRVLLIDSDVDQTDSLRWALEEQSIDVEVRPPAGIPKDLAELQAYECLMLSNVPATAMTVRQMDLIRLYVQDLGGGFIMLGGDQAFGLGGYYRTQIEEILPVRSNFEKEREKPSLAMVLVIDKSGSMGGEKIELAKDAARAAVELLGPKDSLGVIAFDGDSYIVSEVRTASDKRAISDAIATIQASGGTNMYPAMSDAYDQLRNASARLKHVIMMTDGQSTPGDFHGMASDMAASQITLSTVALGQGASEDLLEELAQIGGGRYYFCNDPQSVPQVFAKETVEASQSAINELPFIPQLVRPTSVLEGIETELSPLLLGYVVTRPKATAEFILASEAGDPLLVWWRYGLGMSVAFTSDAKSRWASEWLTWPEFGPFWAQIIRHAMRKNESNGIYVDLAREGEQTRIKLDAIDEAGQFIDRANTQVTIIEPTLKRKKVDLLQTAPGRFEALIDTNLRGAYHFDISQERTSGAQQRLSRGVNVGYPEELRLMPVAEEVLRNIARQSGGRYQPTPEEIARPDGRTAREPLPLWPLLLASAILLFISDVALRRIEFWPGKV